MGEGREEWEERREKGRQDDEKGRRYGGERGGLLSILEQYKEDTCQ